MSHFVKEKKKIVTGDSHPVPDGSTKPAHSRLTTRVWWSLVSREGMNDLKRWTKLLLYEPIVSVYLKNKGQRID